MEQTMRRDRPLSPISKGLVKMLLLNSQPFPKKPSQAQMWGWKDLGLGHIFSEASPKLGLQWSKDGYVMAPHQLSSSFSYPFMSSFLISSFQQPPRVVRWKTKNFLESQKPFLIGLCHPSDLIFPVSPSCSGHIASLLLLKHTRHMWWSLCWKTLGSSCSFLFLISFRSLLKLTPWRGLSWPFHIRFLSLFIPFLGFIFLHRFTTS